MDNKLTTYFSAPFKIFGFAFKSVITLLFIASLFLNITMLVWQTGAFAVSTAFAGLTGMSSVITGLKNTNDSLKKTNKNLVVKNNTLQKQNKNLLKNKKHISKITKRIMTRTSIGAARNLASVPVEAIPTVGVAAVVGVTAFELKEACETMKDMNELNALMGIEVLSEIEASIEEKIVCSMEVPSADEVMDQVINSPRAAWEAMSNWDIELPSWDDWGNKYDSMKDSIGQVWSKFRSLI